MADSCGPGSRDVDGGGGPLGPGQGGRQPEGRGRQEPRDAHAGLDQQGAHGLRQACRHCHGLRGLGDGPLAPKDPKPADLTDAEWKYGAATARSSTIIANGVGGDSEMKGVRSEADGDRHVEHRQLPPQHRSQEVARSDRDAPCRSPARALSACAVAWLAAVGCGYIDTSTPPAAAGRAGPARRVARRADHGPPHAARRARRLPRAAAGARAADRVPAQHPHRQEDRLHRVLPRERDDGPGGRACRACAPA